MYALLPAAGRSSFVDSHPFAAASAAAIRASLPPAPPFTASSRAAADGIRASIIVLLPFEARHTASRPETAAFTAEATAFASPPAAAAAASRSPIFSRKMPYKTPDDPSQPSLNLLPTSDQKAVSRPPERRGRDPSSKPARTVSAPLFNPIPQSPSPHTASIAEISDSFAINTPHAALRSLSALFTPSLCFSSAVKGGSENGLRTSWTSGGIDTSPSPDALRPVPGQAAAAEGASRLSTHASPVAPSSRRRRDKEKPGMFKEVIRLPVTVRVTRRPYFFSSCSAASPAIRVISRFEVPPRLFVSSTHRCPFFL
mmetsp:Transcript_16442/g.33456  ORF Transcript_16442/g.33456 Transcript_16442/m.33456 type:complete len:313 (+) Transcript_16442:143-1081(+)